MYSICCEKRITKKMIIATILVVISLLALIPVCFISLYNYAAADDYTFGLKAYQAWEGTHSVKHVLVAALDTVKHNYHNWQGTYSAIFLMALQPAVFGASAYKWVPLIIIIPLITSYLLLFYIILCKILKTDKASWVIITTALLFLTILFPLNAVEAFFWYNGSVYYGFFYALCFFLFAGIYYTATAQKRTHRYLAGTITILLSVIIAGGNFTTALITPLLLLITVFLLKINHKRTPMILWLSILCLIAGLIINASAPGNQVRQASFTDRPSAIEAIFRSVIHGAVEIKNWFHLPVLIVFSFITPIIYKALKPSTFRFNHPWVFSILSFGIFCAMFTPPIYAMNNFGPARLLNICHYAFFVLILANLGYYCGYLSHHAPYQMRINRVSQQIRNKVPRFVFSPITIYLLTVVIFSSVALRSKSVSRKAIRTLTSGEAALYKQEMEERMCKYLGPDKELRFEPLSVKPELLFFSDITADKDDWCNKDIALYFQKELVVLKE